MKKLVILLSILVGLSIKAHEEGIYQNLRQLNFNNEPTYMNAHHQDQAAELYENTRKYEHPYKHPNTNQSGEKQKQQKLQHNQSIYGYNTPKNTPLTPPQDIPVKNYAEANQYAARLEPNQTENFYLLTGAEKLSENYIPPTHTTPPSSPDFRRAASGSPKNRTSPSGNEYNRQPAYVIDGYEIPIDNTPAPENPYLVAQSYDDTKFRLTDENGEEVYGTQKDMVAAVNFRNSINANPKK